MKKMIFTLISAAAMLLSGCASDDNSLSDKTLSAADEYVKPIGRTYLAEDGTRWLTQSASGIEFTFTGTEASFDLIGDSNAGTESGKDGYARYAVYVDGEKISDGMMDEASKKVQVFSSDTEKETTVKILKLSECTNSIFGISGINVKSVGQPVPTESKELKIEFIGDSITCGYGVDDEDRDHHFKTDTEDATKAYAYKTAALLDADYSLVSYSGHGIISGYTGDGKKQPLQIVPKYYTKLGRSYSTTDACPVSKLDWDFNSFK
ncbi:MAG: GDSL family lipase, partial [Huintestinicola sp.]